MRSGDVEGMSREIADDRLLVVLITQDVSETRVRRDALGVGHVDGCRQPLAGQPSPHLRQPLYRYSRADRKPDVVLLVVERRLEDAVDESRRYSAVDRTTTREQHRP